MLVALIVVAVVAVGLLALLWQTRSSAAEFRAQAERREETLQEERDGLVKDKAELAAKLSAAEEDSGRLAEQNNANAAEIRRLGGELDKARDAAEAQTAKIERQSEELAALVTDNGALHTRAEAAEAALAAAEARDTGILLGDGLDVSTAQPETLWELELLRSERTWRTSVAIDPSAETSPFDDVDDPVRQAVEIEAGALRENVGAFITIDWQAKPLTSPSHAHLVVRVAQELLEAAARHPEPARLLARGDDDGVTLSLDAEEEGDEVINIIPPRVTSDLIDLREETGASLTVKAE
jgi:uncharacterized protein YoxC